MNPTNEQQLIINHVLSDDVDNQLTLVSSVAGSGKTTLLAEIAHRLQPRTGLYLAYNKSVATEAQSKFPKAVNCLTTHALAYRSTIKQFNLNFSRDLPEFSDRSITEKVSFKTKSYVVYHIRVFCLSKYITFKAYYDTIAQPDHQVYCLAIKYLGLMQSGTIKCTHDFYLKFFHVALAQQLLVFPEFDLVLLDEAGDLNEVTFEIFNLLPARRKLLTGDPYQNVYAFNHTINCFSRTASCGSLYPMTKSFRVASHIASGIEAFCRLTLDPAFSFQGIKFDSLPPIKSRAFIARTNSTLVAKMLQLNALGIPYNLTRTPYQIFELPLVICSIIGRKPITNPAYLHIQSDIDQWKASESLQLRFSSPLAFISSVYKDDVQVSTALSTVAKYGVHAIVSCYEEARKHHKSTHALTLGTSHSCKGLEFDEVEIADDLNQVLTPIMSNIAQGLSPTPSELSELNLYYVAVSRCKVSLLNATHINLTPEMALN